VSGPDIRTKEELNRTLHHLGERVKELTALHSTARLFQNDQLSTKELLQQMAALIPPSWQYPEITAARIQFDNLVITTPNFVASPWVQRAEFQCKDGTSGHIEVVYLENRPPEFEGPFLSEERNLLNSLSDMLKLHLDRKQSESGLRKLSKVFMDATDPIIIEDLEGRVVDVNSETERSYGWLRTELIGQSIDNLIPAEQHQTARDLRKECRGGKAVRNVSSLHRTKRGETLPVLLTLSLLTDESGNALGIATLAKDISELKRAQVALQKAHDQLERRVMERTAELTAANRRLSEEITQRKEAENKLEQFVGEIQRSHEDLTAILNQLDIGTALTDQAGKVMFLSQVAHRLLQKKTEHCIGGHWEKLFDDPTYQTRLREMMGLPSNQRTPVLVRMPMAGGKRMCWVNVDVRDDPRDSKRKMVFLYDASEVQDLRRLLSETGKYQDLIGKSHPMQLIFQQIQDLARVDSTVLIEGETGTGKELVARAMHRASHRKEKPFIAVNCAGLTESLVASQLFGHKRGAFTGAISDQQGLFEAAHEGTLFLDEIGDIPLSVQTSLLRVLQEREVTRVGESRTRKINVRVIAATHHDLAKDVEKEAFRSDLLYRIRVGRIHLPPLRERREDIPLLVSAFLSQCRATTGRPIEALSHEAMRLLVAYSWPGNVRELHHAIEFAVIRCRDSIIQPQDLPPEIIPAEKPTALALSPLDPSHNEKERLLSALEQTRGNRSAAARLLGISRLTLYRRMAKFGLSPNP
jgi:PAS domain S-box-containing protein